MKLSIFERITDQIADAIASGQDTYTMPWHRSGAHLASPVNGVSGEAYRGLNILTLWIIGEERGFTSRKWATYRQWAELGAQVRKGERGTTVVFWKQSAPADDGAGTEAQRRAKQPFVARSYIVFNADQVSGYECKQVGVLCEAERLGRADAFVKKLGATIEHGFDCACYMPSSDIVRMPAFAQFRSPESYYSVLAHELTHWSGARHRLGRDLVGRSSTEAYAMEELVAELGAAFTCARLGIATEPRRDHVPYIAYWRKPAVSTAVQAA